MSVTVTPVSPVLGATVHNLKLSSTSDSQTLCLIQDLLEKYLVLIFPEQDFSVEQLRDFVSQFGPLFVHHADEGVLFCEGVPEVLEMRKEADGVRLFGGSDWHADVTFRKPEGYLSVLYSKIIPPLGGDTAFASTIASFAALSDGMQDMLRNLKAVHSYNGPGQPDHPVETAIHDVVRTHPDSVQQGLYINKMFATRFEGMSDEESRPLIQFLDEHMSSPQFTCRITWAENQIVMWDNRFTLHYPINDFQGYQRSLYRCTALCS